MIRFAQTLALSVALLASTGCALHRARAEIKESGLLAGGEAVAPKDNGTPATVASSGEETRMEVPANSTITETTIEAQPAVAATPETPAQPAVPTTIVREIHLGAPTAIVQKAQRVQTSTGTIDTTVAKHRIDVEDRSKLLWVALVCGVVGMVVRSMFPAWPGLSNGLLIAAAIAFIAWKFADLPQWCFAIPIVIAGAKALGYKRAQWDANGNGIPDIIEKKPPVS